MFTLTICATTPNVDAIKLALTQALPAVKSSHRCEAIARGLGYQTYASLLAACRQNEGRISVVDGAAFQRYLAKHDFNISESALYRAVGRAALLAVSAQWPRLTIWGIGAGDRERRPDGSWETTADRVRKMKDGRACLVEGYAIDAFLASLALLSRVERRKTVRPDTHSYWIKHIAENYGCTFPQGEKLGPVYVPNGILIAAAIHAGFKVKAYADEHNDYDLNVKFNMSNASLRDLDCELRPNGAYAQDRRRAAERRAKNRITRRTGLVYY